MTATLDPVGDHDEIRDVIERYAAAADVVDGEAAAALFADDGEFTIWLDPSRDEPTSSHRGRPAIAKAIGYLDRYVATQHVIANTVVEIDSERATARTQCTAHHVERRDAGLVDRILYITYTDELARPAGHWRFTRRELRVRWTAEQPVSPA